ncbi:pyruvate kinase [Carboxydocella sporoproducens DSM 16521]|uniref:Pyruvate kinase n=2 Tax=Carboxydocella TaxID=178898 RepID=A0A1T4LB01_9FIRM|nr:MULTISPECIES: pyruvate kinase [Carboxydocella]AVX19879.1 pyruvate kinase [Carboxydocella thermautotrophica]SJZ51771.1 pyruvate kinase [Carboxydocella sporoproducens DSM 16521]
MRRTKIICTIGPASEQVETLVQLIEAGMNVARLNFSHGTHEEHGRRVEAIRQASAKANRPVAILLDTKGPEIRLGVLKEKITVNPGDKLILTAEEMEGEGNRIPVTYKGLPEDVREGTSILIDDGLIGLKVERIEGTEIHCVVENGGEISSRKGVNVPGAVINLPALTEKDIADIEFGIKMGMDFIAASFVRKAADVLAIREILEKHSSDMQIIAKIENHEGVNNIDEILKVADGIMVARGDLGVEIPIDEVPLVQKMIIEKCNRAGKPVITATQMLDSMIRNPRPTRAEATDVANAIFDGTDAIMLSGETAAGKYPVEAVKTMARIAERAERALRYEELTVRRGIVPERTTTDAISHATVTTAHDLGASAIICATKSGHTAKMVSKYRPQAPVVAITPKMDVIRKLLLVWGVYPLLCKETKSTDEMLKVSVETALAAGLIKAGDLVVITAGVPVGVPGTTNLIKVHTVGEILAKGTGIGARAVTGTVKVARTAKEAEAKIKPGDILVTIATDKDFVPVMEKCAAVITETGGLTSHAAIVGLNLGIGVVVGVDNATHILEDGTLVTVDGMRGLIYRGTANVL